MPDNEQDREEADIVTSVEGLVAKSQLGPESTALFWAAFRGDSELAEVVAGGSMGPPQPEGSRSGPPVWLSSLAVEGFRGVAGRTELLLEPKPGLTLVVGRNGSGKSSFAEGLEALLTGDNLRWRGRPKAWQEGWRNLHHDGPTMVSAEFQLEGRSGTTEVTRRWGDDFDDSTVRVTGAVTAGGDQVIDFDDLGWRQALANYKPLLSYNELGSMLEDKPSAIYDSMATVLGLDRITEARERLRQARLTDEKPAKEADKARKELVEQLGQTSDARAVEAVEVLSERTPDLARLDQLAFDQPSGSSTALAAIAALPRLDTASARSLGDALEAAVAELAAIDGDDQARADRLAVLVRQALQHHKLDGDGACPVCGQGVLDSTWRSQAEATAREHELASKRLRAAEADLESARQAAQAALVAMPQGLIDRTDTTDGTDLSDSIRSSVATLADRWRQWATAPETGWNDEDLLARLAEMAEVDALIASVRDEANKELAAEDDHWRPLARAITSWVEQARAAALATERAERLSKAEAFAKEAEAELRNQRFQPVADAAAALWGRLRQRSNVSLERVALEGQTTNRRVDLNVTVDGTETSALGVMSQGELHALALALFLPRVSTTDSPFRFLVVDDPVQAMDPARVDGLANVLAGVAENRQVVVMTHDDRLPASCRRLGIEAEIIQVTRQTESRVTATVTRGPAERAIDDAMALARTERLPMPLKRQVVPVHCRRAVEAQALDLAWPRLLQSHTHDQVTQLVEQCHTTANALSLLFFGEIRRSPREVYGEMDRRRPGSARSVQRLNREMHEPSLDLEPVDLVDQTSQLMTMLRETTR